MVLRLDFSTPKPARFTGLEMPTGGSPRFIDWMDCRGTLSRLGPPRAASRESNPRSFPDLCVPAGSIRGVRLPPGSASHALESSRGAVIRCRLPGETSGYPVHLVLERAIDDGVVPEPGIDPSRDVSASRADALEN